MGVLLSDWLVVTWNPTIPKLRMLSTNKLGSFPYLSDVAKSVVIDLLNPVNVYRTANIPLWLTNIWSFWVSMQINWTPMIWCTSFDLYKLWGQTQNWRRGVVGSRTCSRASHGHLVACSITCSWKVQIIIRKMAILAPTFMRRLRIHRSTTGVTNWVYP